MTKDLVELTGEVAPSATVTGLKMSLGEFHAPKVHTDESAIEFSISPTHHKSDEDRAFISTVCYRIRAVTNDDERTETGFRFHAHFDVALQIDGDHSDEAIDAFLKLNSVFVTWSYMREFVQNSTSRMQMRPLTLPLMTASSIASLIKKSQDCDESVIAKD